MVDRTELIIPLSFWYCRNNNNKIFNAEQFFEKYPDIQIIRFLLQEPCQINDVSVLQKMMNDLENISQQYYIERDLFYGVMHFLPVRESIFANEIKIISDRINVLMCHNPIIHMDQYTINGYETYDGNVTLDYVDYSEWRKEWFGKESMTYDEFSTEFENSASSNWNKIDVFGEELYEIYENEQIQDLNRKNNCKKLFELPYSKSFLIYTLKFAWGSLHESVRYSNHLCEIMKKKINESQ